MSNVFSYCDSVQEKFIKKVEELKQLQEDTKAFSEELKTIQEKYKLTLVPFPVITQEGTLSANTKVVRTPEE